MCSYSQKNHSVIMLAKLVYHGLHKPILLFTLHGDPPPSLWITHSSRYFIWQPAVWLKCKQGIQYVCVIKGANQSKLCVKSVALLFSTKVVSAMIIWWKHPNIAQPTLSKRLWSFKNGAKMVSVQHVLHQYRFTQQDVREIVYLMTLIFRIFQAVLIKEVTNNL